MTAHGVLNGTQYDFLLLKSFDYSCSEPCPTSKKTNKYTIFSRNRNQLHKLENSITHNQTIFPNQIGSCQSQYVQHRGNKHVYNSSFLLLSHNIPLRVTYRSSASLSNSGNKHFTVPLQVQITRAFIELYNKT